MRAYPLSAVVGMDDLALSLLLTAVAPDIGGVLIRGEKGTAKSTAVRALATLLPDVDVVPACRFACDPRDPDPSCPDGPHPIAASTAPHRRPSRLVELPVGASEDRLLGSLDLERALTAGQKAYEPGLLAAAHRGLLYVDEVNLLHDHLVDVLLDAAAMGRVHVERDGVSVSHAARFVLVGTMNPEEGELRPQLLDRFGLTVHVAASREPKTRAEVVRRRLAFDADPDGFALKAQDAEQDLADRIASARERVTDVRLPDSALEQITALCAAFDVDGMRADLVMARAAAAHAAWSDRDVVTSDDVRTAARFALPHRRRRDPFDAPGIDEELLDQVLDQVRRQQRNSVNADRDDGDEPGDDRDHGDGDEPGDGSGDEPGGDGGGPGGPPSGRGSGPAEAPTSKAAGPGLGDDNAAPNGSSGGSSAQPPVASGQPYRVRTLKVPGLGHGSAGRRSKAITTIGKTIGAQPFVKHQGQNLHLPATLHAAAGHQLSRGRSGPGLVLHREDLRLAIREGREGNLVLFCVDASGSMAAKRRMMEVKGAVMSLLLDAYQRRDRIGLITFRGSDADLVLPPTGAVEAARPRLERLPTGGRTPIDAGLRRCHAVITTERLRDPRRRPLLVLVTDGRHTYGPDPVASAARLASVGVRSVVVDCERGPVRLHLAQRLAGHLGGELVGLEHIRAQALAGIVRERAADRPLAGRNA